jgi:SAM-dependent methyltransferase
MPDAYFAQHPMNAFHRWYCRSAHWNRALARLIPWALADLRLGDHVLELGPGPGGVTPWLAAQSGRITTIDLDARVAAPTPSQMSVRALRGDATALPFAPGTFSAVVAFTMLHHVPTEPLQDQLFAEAVRTLRPGGIFAALDVRPSVALRVVHLGDTWMPIALDTLAARLGRAGLRDVVIGTRSGYFRCAAVRALPLL